MRRKHKKSISRRASLGGGLALACTGREAVAASFRSLSKPVLDRARPRVVAFQSVLKGNGQAFCPAAAMDNAATTLGTFDLIAFHAFDHAVPIKDVSLISERASAYSCYVALGVILGRPEPVLRLIGPGGQAIEHLDSSAGSGIFKTDLGVLALTLDASVPSDSTADIVVQSASRRSTAPQGDSYLVRLESQRGHNCHGSAIYGPDGAAITRTGAGWTQGIVTTLDVAQLRRRKLQELQA